MKFSVVIPTKNRFEDLKETLEHLLVAIPETAEVIIVDQSEKTFKIAIEKLFKGKKTALKYHYKPTIHSLTEARDFGFKKTRFEIVLFLDDDITVQPDFFTILSEAYRRYPNIDAFSAIDTTDENTSLLRFAGRMLFSLGPFWDERIFAYRFHKFLHKPIRTKKFSAGYMSLKRKVYEAIGFDLNLKGHVFIDDVDFTYRASEQFNLALLPELKAIHRQPKNLLYDIQEGEKKRVHGRLFFFQKHARKNIFNYLAFYWAITGLFFSMILRCLFLHSTKPLQGFIMGFSKAHHVK